MEIGWWKRDDDGQKYQVHLNLFGGKLKWSCQRKRAEPWTDYRPVAEDWETALREADDRYQRRLIRKNVVEMIRRRGVG